MKMGVFASEAGVFYVGQTLSPNGVAVILRRGVSAGAAVAGAAVGTDAITGFPTIWAQKIKDIALRHVVLGREGDLVQRHGPNEASDRQEARCRL
jgi:hypothetical protein